MLGIIQSAALVGVEAYPVQVEVNTGEAGELKFILVGLPDTAVKESQDRVFSALANSGYRPPTTRTTINLAPGDLRKEGPAYDLPIALGVLLSMKKVDEGAADEFLDRWRIEFVWGGAPRQRDARDGPARQKVRQARLIVPAQSAMRLHWLMVLRFIQSAVWIKPFGF